MITGDVRRVRRAFEKRGRLRGVTLSLREFPNPGEKARERRAKVCQPLDVGGVSAWTSRQPFTDLQRSRVSCLRAWQIAKARHASATEDRRQAFIGDRDFPLQCDVLLCLGRESVKILAGALDHQLSRLQ